MLRSQMYTLSPRVKTVFAYIGKRSGNPSVFCIIFRL